MVAFVERWWWQQLHLRLPDGSRISSGVVWSIIPEGESTIFSVDVECTRSNKSLCFFYCILEIAKYFVTKWSYFSYFWEITQIYQNILQFHPIFRQIPCRIMTVFTAWSWVKSLRSLLWPPDTISAEKLLVSVGHSGAKGPLIQFWVGKCRG